MSRFVAGLALAVSAAPAAACINDVELPNHEREFRSQYRGPAVPPTVSPAEPTNRPGNGLLIGTGVVLLTAATAFALAGRRTGN